MGTWIVVDPSLLRIVRISRLFRMSRLARAALYSDSLYLLLTALRGSVEALWWSGLLLTLLQVVVALVVNSTLVFWYFDGEGDVEERKLVFEYWGSFSRSILTTFEITLADFPHPTRLLVGYVSEWFMIFFIVHKLTIGFAVIAVINGVFLQETLAVASNDDQLMIRQRVRAKKMLELKMRRLFEVTDESGDGLVDAEEFQSAMVDPGIRTWMDSMELDVERAEEVFRLVDVDGKEQVTAEVFVNGLAHLMGNARNLDLQILLREQEQLRQLLSDTILPKLGHVADTHKKPAVSASLSRLSLRPSSRKSLV